MVGFNKKVIKYGSIVIIGLCIYCLFKIEFVSGILLSKLGNELIPFAMTKEESKSDLIEEIFPIFAIYNMEDDVYYSKIFMTDSGSKTNSTDSDLGKTEGGKNGGNDLNETNTDSIMPDGIDSTINESDSDELYTGISTSTDAANINETCSDAQDNANNSNQTDNINEVMAVDVSSNNPAPIVYQMDQLQNYDFLLANCYTVDSSTNVKPEEIDINTLLSMDMTVDLSSEEYKVLIYHTHGSEAFCDSRPGVVEDTVIGVGDELAYILENQYGIKVYHDRNIYDTVNGVLDRSYAYNLASDSIDEILANNPSIEVVLDIHRDGVREDLVLAREINGKPTAQIMFLNGMSRLNTSGDIAYLYNPHKQENLSFALQMHLLGKRYYGDLMRNIYVRGYCFNLDKVARSALVEVGAQTNTVAEAKNAMEPLAKILYETLSKKQF